MRKMSLDAYSKQAGIAKASLRHLEAGGGTKLETCGKIVDTFPEVTYEDTRRLAQEAPPE